MDSINEFLKWYNEQDPSHIENLNNMIMEQDRIDFNDFELKILLIELTPL